MLSGYLRLAAWVFVIVIGTGTITALVLVPLSAMLTSTYGQTLLIKLALVGLAAAMALTARRTLGHSSGHHDRLPLGALAGQIGISAAASAGQLVVRLSTPRRGDYYAPQPPPVYTISGQVTTNQSSATALEFRGCGESCFVSTVAWRDGDNVLTLRVAAPSWRGGTVSLLIPWPVQPGADELTRAVATLRAAGHLTAARLLAGAKYASGGWSVGAIALVAGWVARTEEPDVRIAAVFPDGPQRYFDTVFNDDYCHRHGLLTAQLPTEPDEIAHPTEHEVTRWTRCRRVLDPTAGQEDR